ncbi:hypothetical protein LSAT2_023835 [Lamellibrachia satsuma]|nr:hypothetical protein LSAT2_023835 [Lamellibrachia satsuma]
MADEQDASCRQTHARNEERYNRQSRPLPQLRIGTQVRLQNPITKKWDRVGVIIGIGRHRDYHVKLPSGRVYWRNRRFMKPDIAQSENYLRVDNNVEPEGIVTGHTERDDIPSPCRNEPRRSQICCSGWSLDSGGESCSIPPPDMPEIVGYRNGSTVPVDIAYPITLVCRADHGDWPVTLTWTNSTHEIHEGTRYYTEPHDFRNLTNAVNELTFMPTLGDDNTTLSCVANKSRPERLEHVVVILNVSYTISPTLEFCPVNQTLEAARCERVNVSWSEPEFSESLGFQLNVTSTFGTNTTSLSLGEHRVEYTARNTYNDRETACTFFVDVRRLPEGTTHAESESSTETTDSVSPTGFVHPAGPFVEDQPVWGSFTWLVIVASCVGAIMLLGAAMMLYHRRKKRGQLLLNDGNFENPVYETTN